MFKKFLVGALAFSAVAGVLNAGDAPGVNLALNAKATASSRESDSLSAANVTDGNPYNRWGSQHSDPQWIRLDLGKPKTFSCIVLFWEAHSTNYKIEVSNDGQNWKTIHVQKNGQGKIEDIYLKKNATARYVRLYSEKRATGYGVSLHEIQLFVK